MKSLTFAAAAVAAAAVLAAAAPASAQAAAFAGSVTIDPTLVIPVADGCGINGWRGPWGHCHYDRGHWVGPGWYHGYRGNGCPPGYWRGPWGHCRNTPYHGPLPGGGWK